MCASTGGSLFHGNGGYSTNNVVGYNTYGGIVQQNGIVQQSGFVQQNGIVQQSGIVQQNGFVPQNGFVQQGNSGKGASKGGSGGGFTSNGIGGMMVNKNPTVPRYWWPSTCNGNGKYWYQFVFENGLGITGYSDDADIDTVVPGVGSPITLHVSCSDVYSNVVNGLMYGEKQGPTFGVDPGLVEVKILKTKGCAVEKECCAGPYCLNPPVIEIVQSLSLDVESSSDNDFGGIITGGAVVFTEQNFGN